MVTYFSIEETPGVSYFGCETLRAKLPVNECATMWRKANRGTAEQREMRSACKNCPIGATHAGESASSISPLRNTKTCGRCANPARRLISKHLCISCYNRQAEWLKGKNAKGCVPSRMAQIDARLIEILHDGEPREVYLPLSANDSEIIIAAIRDSQGEVTLKEDMGRTLAELAKAVEVRDAA